VREPDIQRLRAAFKRRRSEVGHRTDVAFADAAGIPYRTLVNLLAGKPTRIEDAVELHLGWAQGSVAALRAGGEASVTEENPGRQVQVDRPSVGGRSEDESYVADRGPNDPPGRISDAELLAVIRRQRQELDELERRISGRPVEGA
jgi:hypothetical protein